MVFAVVGPAGPVSVSTDADGEPSLDAACTGASGPGGGADGDHPADCGCVVGAAPRSTGWAAWLLLLLVAGRRRGR